MSPPLPPGQPAADAPEILLLRGYRHSSPADFQGGTEDQGQTPMAMRQALHLVRHLPSLNLLFSRIPFHFCFCCHLGAEAGEYGIEDSLNY